MLTCFQHTASASNTSTTATRTTQTNYHQRSFTCTCPPLLGFIDVKTPPLYSSLCTLLNH